MTTHELATKLLSLPDQEILIGNPNGVETHSIGEIVRVPVKETDLRDNPQPFFVITPECK